MDAFSLMERIPRARTHHFVAHASTTCLVFLLRCARVDDVPCVPAVLPPCRLEPNPAEPLWKALREDWFANIVFHDLDAAEDALDDVLVTLESDLGRVRRVTGFGWVTSI